MNKVSVEPIVRNVKIELFQVASSFTFLNNINLHEETREREK